MYGKCACSYNFKWCLINNLCVDLNRVNSFNCITDKSEFNLNIFINKKIKPGDISTTRQINNSERFMFFCCFHIIWTFFWLLSYKLCVDPPF